MTAKPSPLGLSAGILLITFAGSLGLAEVQAQPEPMRWGQIPDEHVSLDSYAADSSAAAVVLGSYSNVEIDENLEMLQDVHRRVKLFSEAAFDMATIEITYVHRGRSQRMQRVEGQTFVRDGAGGLRRVELQRGDIHEEEDGDITRVRFTLPALEPGAIFEYRYRIRTESASTVPEWLFQDKVPTLWSEYRASFPAFITINRHPTSDPIFHIQEIDERPFHWDDVEVRTTLRRERAGGFGRGEARTREVVSGVNIRSTTFRWVMKDVPALKPEDFVASIWNHAFGMRFQLSGYYDRNMVFRPLSQSWNDVAERVRENENFGRRLRAPRAVREQAEVLTADAASDVEKVKAIYDFVRGSIVWDERYRLYAARPLDRVLDSRNGSSSEINLLLIAMLRVAGIDANPVLISTRSHGRAIGWFTSTRQFNHVIAVAQVDRQEFFLDATDPHRPMNMLPVQALNVEGWLLSEHSFGWIPIHPGRSVVAIEVEGELAESGSVSGSFRTRFEGYPALQLRKRLSGAGDDDERKAAVAGRDASVTYTALVVDGLEEDGEIRAEVAFEWADRGQPMAHLLTLNPILMGALEENPFSNPTRTYPVDFAHPTMYTYTATIRIPDDYVVDELPSHVRLATPGNGIRYARVVTFTGGRLRVQRTLDVSQTQFEPGEYAALRELYEEITAADAAMVVLARRGGPAE